MSSFFCAVAQKKELIKKISNGIKILENLVGVHFYVFTHILLFEQNMGEYVKVHTN